MNERDVEALLRESLLDVRGPSPERVASLRARAAAPVPREPSRRARRPLLLASAAAALVVAVVAGAALLRRDDGPVVPREEVAVEEVEAGIDADATLIAHTWGTEITLVASGLEAGAEYAVSFVAEDGERVEAGSFLGVGAEPVTCNLNAALLRPDARSFEVADPDGDVVLRADLV